MKPNREMPKRLRHCRRFEKLNIAIVVAAVAGVLTVPGLSLGGNTRPYLMGTEAAMTGGAGIAVISDSGTIWYNPAGLGGVKLNNLQVSAAVFSARFRRVPNFVSADLPTGQVSQSAGHDTVGSVPGAAVFVRNPAPNWSWGLGLYGTDSDSIELTGDIRAPLDEVGGTWDQNAAVYIRSQVYHLGPALGWSVTPRLRLGLALLASYHGRTSDVYASAAAGQSGTATQTMTAAEHRYSGDFAVMLRGGLQWEVSERWHLGVVISTPSVSLLTLRDASILHTAAPGDESAYGHEFSNAWDWKFSPIEAAAFQLGVAYRKPDRFWVGAEFEIRPPLADDRAELLWNASIGTRLYLTEKLNWGIGFFTDNSSNPPPKSPLNAQIDNYGLTTGGELIIPLVFQGRDGERTVYWSAAASVSYVFGVGEAGTIRMTPEASRPYTTTDSRIYSHRAVLYISTAMYF